MDFQNLFYKMSKEIPFLRAHPLGHSQNGPIPVPNFAKRNKKYLFSDRWLLLLEYLSIAFRKVRCLIIFRKVEFEKNFCFFQKCFLNVWVENAFLKIVLTLVHFWMHSFWNFVTLSVDFGWWIISLLEFKMKQRNVQNCLLKS